MTKNTDKRAERLKQNLRANLLKRKDQTRERANDSAVVNGQPEAQTKSAVASGQTKNEQPEEQQDKKSNEQ